MRALPILQGRRFGCTRCAHCCIEPGVVYLMHDEVKRISEYLQLTPTTFERRFGVRRERDSGEVYLDARDGSGCPLLTDDGRCSVHPVKPIQCSTFPFWNELLDDAAGWEAAKSFCPGLDAPDGRLYSRKEIAAIRAGLRAT